MQRGQRLTLRGTLPPKPGDGDKPKQYTISPGLPATAEGLKIAVIKAQKIEADLIYGRFSWETEKDNLTVEFAIADFEKHYWATREKTINRTNNYKYDYLDHFLYLPQDEILTAELLKDALLHTTPDSRKRRGRAIAYRALLEHFNIDNDLNKYKGNYQPRKKRTIPTLEEIDEYWNRMRSPQWKWVFGIIACYGIRQCLFNCTFLSNLMRSRITQGLIFSCLDASDSLTKSSNKPEDLSNCFTSPSSFSNFLIRFS